MSRVDTGEAVRWFTSRYGASSHMAKNALELPDETWRAWVVLEGASQQGPIAINNRGTRRSMDLALGAVARFLTDQSWLTALLIEDDMLRLGDTVEPCATMGLIDDRYVNWTTVPTDSEALERFVLASSSYTPLIALGLTASPAALGLREGLLGPEVIAAVLRQVALLATTAFDDEGFVLLTAPTVDVALTEA